MVRYYNAVVLNCKVTSNCLLDIDECALGMDNCENDTTFCVNTIGYFECLCLPGYVDPNGTSCQRKLK